jgi:hypothetical protein
MEHGYADFRDFSLSEANPRKSAIAKHPCHPRSIYYPKENKKALHDRLQGFQVVVL